MQLKNKIVFLLFGLTVVLISVSSCKKDPPFTNPFDDPELDPPPSTNPNTSNIPTDNFAYLHSKIFKPTCANSGCHDGTFPPDYRTVNSAYNTLVYQKPVNTAGGLFRYRVYPYKADSSILYHRLNVVLGAGLMPLVVDPASDWNSKSAEYILNIKNWINAGAKDMFGNYPKPDNQQPHIGGFLAYPNGNTTTPYPRAAGNIAPFEVPGGSSIDLWFLAEDDSTLPQNISYNICKMSGELQDFSAASSTPITYSSTGLTGNDFMGMPRQFTHMTTISTVGFPVNTFLYIRVYIDDGDQGGPTEIPNNGTNDVVKGFFSIKIM